MRLRPGPFALCAAIVLATGCFANQYRHNPRIGIIDGDPIVQMKPQGDLPSVDSAPLVPAEKHSDRPDEVDWVVGLVLGSEARAYPIGLLDKYEVVNDAAGGLPFVVVRCALTGIAAAYERRVADRTLIFENSGALWRDTLVLRDRETGTYWTVATGRALSGPLAGAQLRGLPVSLTAEERWRHVHPESLYLDLGRSTAVPLAMRLYEASAAQGVSGVKTSDRRFKPKVEVGVVGGETETLVFRADELRKAERVEARLDGQSIVLEWDAALAIARAYETGNGRRELPILRMYWFAVTRHFARVRTLAELAGRAVAARTLSLESPFARVREE